MNQEVFDTLLDALREDYKLFVSKFDTLAEQHPDLEFDEVNAMVVHEPKEEMAADIVKLTEEYPMEYDLAADTVYVEAVMEAMFSEVR
jgi:hypothetical protein